MQQGRRVWAHALRCDQVGDKGRDTEAERRSWEAVAGRHELHVWAYI